MEALYPFHPRFVHFPIALSLVGVALIFLEGWLGGQWVYKLGVGVR